MGQKKKKHPALFLLEMAEEFPAEPGRKRRRLLPFRGSFSKAIEMLQQRPASSQPSTEPQIFVSAKTCLESFPFPRNAVAEETVYFGFRNACPGRVLCPAHTHMGLNKWVLFLLTPQRERNNAFARALGEKWAFALV